MKNNPQKKGAWFRLHVSLLHSDSFMDLSDSAVSLYVKLYLLAKRGDGESECPPGTIGGELGAYTFQQIAKHLYYVGNEGILQAALNELIQAGRIDLERGHYRVSNYEDDQETYAEYAERKAKGAARVAAHRARAQAPAGDENAGKAQASQKTETPLAPDRIRAVCELLKIGKDKADDLATGNPSHYIDLLKYIQDKRGGGWEVAAQELAEIAEAQRVQARAEAQAALAQSSAFLDDFKPPTDEQQYRRLLDRKQRIPALFTPAQAAELATLEAKLSNVGD